MTAGETTTAIVGLSFEAWAYEVTREKIRHYADAVGETSPLYFERRAAVAAGFRDIVAPPMFAVVFCRWMQPAIFDERVGIDYARMLHGAQSFDWFEPVCAGDTVTTSATVSGAHHKRDLRFVVFDSISRNQRDQDVVAGRWTMIVRRA